jgi:hypothetical protein
MKKTMFPMLIALTAQAALAAPAFAQTSIALGERDIRRGEVVAFVKKQFAQMDTNRDANISPREYEAYRARQGERSQAGLGYIGRSWFEKSDVDGNGRISLAEAQGRPLQFFDMADVDGDGIASVREQGLASLFLGR